MNKCCICGRYCGWRADSSTPFGNSYSMEPPEPEFYCRRCARKEEREALRTGRLFSDWIPARWQLRVAKKLGYVRAGPKGASWATFFKPDQVPPDYCVH